MLGGAFTEKALQVLNPDGRLSQIAYLTGANATIHWPTVMQKRLTLTGSTLRHKSNAVKASIARGLETHVMPLAAKGLKPVVESVFPLHEAAEAHRALENNTHNGKIVLAIKG
jgi:NADPH2:quinone reductase